MRKAEYEAQEFEPPDDGLSLADDELTWFRRSEDAERLLQGLIKAGLTAR